MKTITFWFWLIFLIGICFIPMLQFCSPNKSAQEDSKQLQKENREWVQQNYVCFSSADGIDCLCCNNIGDSEERCALGNFSTIDHMKCSVALKFGLSIRAWE